MIELFFVTSPNVYKISIALEEMELAHVLRPIDLSQGLHRKPENIGGAVSGKLPVIIDDQPADGGAPITIMESGAILQYLAEKSGCFLPKDDRGRIETLQWLHWQVAGVGPIGGQVWHFLMFAPLIAPDFDNSYAADRYFHMYSALWRVMDDRLADRAFLASEYSIADMACFPWISYVDPREGIDGYPHVRRWREAIAARPAVRRAYQRAADLDTGYARNEKGGSLFPWEGLLEHVIVT